MTRSLLSAATLNALVLVACAGAHAQDAAPPATQTITRAGEQAVSFGVADHFTGRVRVERLFAPNASIHASGAYVSFEPGARSAWHTHPAGQRLVVTSGMGLTQAWGQPVQQIRSGDVVWCPPGVKHWHGAAPNSAMTHLAVGASVDGQSVVWLEKVSDEQYNAR